MFNKSLHVGSKDSKPLSGHIPLASGRKRIPILVVSFLHLFLHLLIPPFMTQSSSLALNSHSA